ncbi:hypothetical protein ACTZO1_28520, partial [Klebsiella pneumoniae]
GPADHSRRVRRTVSANLFLNQVRKVGYMSMPSDANKSNGDNNNTVAAREYRQLKFFERTKPSP